jgi:hypothetical protein
VEEAAEKRESPVQPRPPPPFTCVAKVDKALIFVDNPPSQGKSTLIERASYSKESLYPQKSER